MFHKSLLGRAGAGLLSCALFIGCATTSNPSAQLYEAERAYNRASSGRAAELAPDRLLTAKETLERAQREAPGSVEEQQLSYLAARQARMAEVYAALIGEQRELALGRAAEEQEERQRRARAEEQLSQTRAELGSSQRSLAASSAQLRERDRQMSSLEGALGEEKSAREAAEKRAADALASLEKVASVKSDATETVITLSGAVLFATGQSELLPIAREKLDQVVAAVKDMGDDRQLLIEGHTDSRGSRAKNQVLSLERARVVRDYLVSQGIDPKRVEAAGIGPDRPLADNATAEGRAENRRVEIHVRPAGRAPSPPNR